MGKIMDMIYANSQCASVYFQMFDMNCIRTTDDQNIDSAKFSQRNNETFLSPSKSPTRKGTERGLKADNFSPNLVGEYMYVEMAHYTDDDTVVLICVPNINNF